MAKAINLDNLQKFRQEYDKRLENGSLVPSKALTAKELETISAESGDTQETPFILQGTGTANGTSSVDTGTVGKHIQKQGSVYCVNQLVQNGNFANSDGWNTSNGSISVSNNIGTFVATAQNGMTTHNVSFIKDHVYYLKVSVKLTTGTTSVYLRSQGNNRVATKSTTEWQELYIIYTSTQTGSNSVAVRDDRASGWDAIQIKNYECIDLTQWFNGNIPTSLTADNFSLYHNYGDYIPYNTGELVSSSGRYLVCGGRNVWDEQWEQGYYNPANTNKVANSDRIRSKDFISVIGGKQYILYEVGDTTHTFNYLFFNENKQLIDTISHDTASGTPITLPSSCKYIKFYSTGTWYGGTYKNDITFSLYYAGEDYSQYYPYVSPKVYDTGTETLLSTGVALDVSGERTDAYDSKEPDGTITRRVGVVDLGTLNWYYNGYSFAVALSGAKIPSSGSVKANMTCAKYEVVSYSNNGNKKISLYTNGQLYVFDSDYTSQSTFKTAMSGVYLIYELATPTTEQGTPFSENIEIDDFGTMAWYSAYTDSNTNTFVNVPQGCQIFYPAWYVGFIDTLGQRADIDWDASNVVSQTQLGASETQRDTIDSQLKDTIGGTLRNMISGVDFNNTKYIDLGSLSWTYNSSIGFYATISDIKLGTDTSGITTTVCTKYQKHNTSAGALSDKEYVCGSTFIGGNYITIKDTSYTDATTFKNAMKGILLAYEKAS